MRIVDVQFHLFPVPAAVPAFRWRAGLPGSEPASVGGVLRILTDDGHEGLAPTHRGVIVADLVERRIRAELLGQDPLQREWLWRRLWELDRIEEFPIYALGLVDTALWDLGAKQAGLPLYHLLGGYRTSLPAYASTVTFASLEEYLDVADQCLALGYPALKLHAWGDARRDASSFTLTTRGERWQRQAFTGWGLWVATSGDTTWPLLGTLPWPRTTYQYYGVPDRLFRALLEAPSKGSFLHARIKSSFQYKRVR